MDHKLITYRPVTGEQIPQYAAKIIYLYGRVFAEPPTSIAEGHITEFADHLEGYRQQPGFRCHTAWDDEDLIGFALTITMAAGRWFGRAVEPGPAEVVAADKAFVVEWAVDAAYRGRGVGRILILGVLANRSEPYAVLAVYPTAPVRDLYERAGWTQAGTTAPTEVNPRPTMHLMSLPLPVDSP